MELFASILGIFMIYVQIHFLVIQFLKSWKERTKYEKFVTIVFLVVWVLNLLIIFNKD